MTTELETLVMPNYRQLCDKFTEIVAAQLHYFERADGIDLSKATYKEIQEMQTGHIERYRDDSIFHAKVQSIVANLLQAAQAEHDDRISKFGRESGRFKIVAA